MHHFLLYAPRSHGAATVPLDECCKGAKAVSAVAAGWWLGADPLLSSGRQGVNLSPISH